MLETILEKYTMEVVVNRTKISRRNLEKLRDKDFTGFTRPQAFGFVRILEREFGEDFGDLKAELDAFLKESPLPVNEPIFIREKQQGDGGSKRWLAAVLLAALVGLGIYLFQKEFSSQPAAENATAPTAQPAVSPAATRPASVAEPAAEEGGTKPEASPDTAQPAAPDAMEQPAQEAAPAAAEEEKKAEEPYVPLEPVALTPVVKLWFGIIDLKTKKRTAKVTANPYEIDSHGKKLLVTGHGRFEISDAFGNLFKFNDARKHYFLIDDGMVREIDGAEFRRLNGGKGW
ncbi:hypothetical protein [Hydrogenimonas sp.]